MQGLLNEGGEEREFCGVFSSIITQETIMSPLLSSFTTLYHSI